MIVQIISRVYIWILGRASGQVVRRLEFSSAMCRTIPQHLCVSSETTLCWRMSWKTGSGYVSVNAWECALTHICTFPQWHAYHRTESAKQVMPTNFLSISVVRKHAAVSSMRPWDWTCISPACRPNLCICMVSWSISEALSFAHLLCFSSSLDSHLKRENQA